MARPSSRKKIITAANAVIERDGIAHLTLESVAAEAGLTKGGLQYHFASKEELLDAVESDVWAQVDAAATRALGKEVDLSTPDERLAAMIRSFAHADVRTAELQIVLNGAGEGPVRDNREALFWRWSGEDERPLSPRQWVALLASDGLWTRDALGRGFSEGMREQIVAAMLDLAEG